MTEVEFENGYWYTTDLKKFADKIGIPSAGKLRKDELEKAIRHFIRTKEVKSFAKRAMTKEGPRDIDKGLRLDLPVVHFAFSVLHIGSEYHLIYRVSSFK